MRHRRARASPRRIDADRRQAGRHSGASRAAQQPRKSGAALEDYFDALRFGLPRPPVLAHRLDRDTSGCLVLGRHRKATASLGLLFKHNKIGKTYWAVVEGGPDERRRHHRHPARPAQRGARLVAEAGPERPAVDDQLEGARTRSEDRSSPGSRSSRSPAARINCACIARRWAGRSSATASTARRRATAGRSLHLHAREISVPLSKNKPPVQVAAPVPEHMRERLRLCGWNPRRSQAISAVRRDR